MRSEYLLYPLLAHVLLALLLYALLTLSRASAVWGLGKTSARMQSFKALEPRINANLSNQFEWPMMFYAVCVLLMSKYPLVGTGYLWAAWVFVGGRLVHSWVQVFTGNVRLRGLIFTINFVAVLMMWLLLIFQIASS